MRLTYNEKQMLSYIKHYPEWVSYVNTLADARQAIQYKPDRVQTSITDDTTFILAMRIEEYQERIDKVERCLHHVCRTDTRTSQMRDALCYGSKRPRMSKNAFYDMRKMIADALIEVFTDWDDEDERRD